MIDTDKIRRLLNGEEYGDCDGMENDLVSCLDEIDRLRAVNAALLAACRDLQAASMEPMLDSMEKAIAKAERSGK